MEKTTKVLELRENGVILRTTINTSWKRVYAVHRNRQSASFAMGSLAMLTMTFGRFKSTTLNGW